MQRYELVFISPIQLTDHEREETMRKVVDAASSLGMRIIEHKEAGRRKLAYPVKKATQGHYFLVDLEAEPMAVERFDKELRLRSDILRYFMVKRSRWVQKELPRRRLRPEQEEAAIPYEGAGRRVEPERQEEKRPERVDKIKLEDLDKKLDEILKEDV